MNDQLQQALTEILNKTMEATGKATNFLVSEIPDVLQQLLVWKMAMSIIFFALGTIGSIVIIWLTWKAYKYFGEKYKNTRSSGNEFFCFYGIIFLIATIPMINFTWLQIWLAPKVFLLEYAASLAK